MSNSTISGNKKERIMDFNRLSEIYDKMDPTECIDYMHETTCFDDETGEYRLDIPEWPSLEPEWPWHENEPRQVITYTMKNWSEEDCENIKEDYLKLIDLIRKSVKTFSIEEGIAGDQVIARASRVAQLMLLNAPDCVIECESRMLAQAMVINRFAIRKN